MRERARLADSGLSDPNRSKMARKLLLLFLEHWCDWPRAAIGDGFGSLERAIVGRRPPKRIATHPGHGLLGFGAELHISSIFWRRSALLPRRRYESYRKAGKTLLVNLLWPA
jgi:hypothetical protein